MKYRISSKAKSDLIGIWEFTFKHWSLEQADKYYQIIIDKIKNICIKPDIGKSYQNIRPGYWGAPVKSHIIFYKVADENTIEVVRVLHQRMDYQGNIGE